MVVYIRRAVLYQQYDVGLVLHETASTFSPIAPVAMSWFEELSRKHQRTTSSLEEEPWNRRKRYRDTISKAYRSLHLVTITGQQPSIDVHPVPNKLEIVVT